MPEETIQDDPDGWVIIHHRATDTVYFGPFATLAEAYAFAEANRGVSRNFVPMWRSVDWSR